MAVLVCNQVTTKETSSARTKTVAIVEREKQTLVSLSVFERRMSVPDPDLLDKGGGSRTPPLVPPLHVNSTELDFLPP